MTPEGDGLREIANYLPLVLICATVPVWLFAVWSYIAMLRHVREGEVLRMMFDPFWWIQSRAEPRLLPEGMVHYRRLTWALVGFIGLILAAMAMIVALQLS